MKALVHGSTSVYDLYDGGAGLGCDESGGDVCGSVGPQDPINVSQVSYDPTSLFNVGWNTPAYSGTPTNTTNGTTAMTVANTASILGSITNSFTNIFKAIQPLPSGCAQVAGPYGMSTQCTPQGSQGLNLMSSTGIGGISPILLIGGAVVLFMMMKKG